MRICYALVPTIFLEPGEAGFQPDSTPCVIVRVAVFDSLGDVLEDLRVDPLILWSRLFEGDEMIIQVELRWCLSLLFVLLLAVVEKLVIDETTML